MEVRTSFEKMCKIGLVVATNVVRIIFELNDDTLNQCEAILNLCSIELQEVNTLNEFDLILIKEHAFGMIEEGYKQLEQSRQMLRRIENN